jgi:EF hand
MKRSALLVALSAASLVGSVAFAQTYSQPQPSAQPQPSTPKPDTAKPATDTTAGYNLMQLDKNKDGSVDKKEAMVSTTLPAIFDKADTNKDGKLDAAELSAASSMSKTK